MIFFLSLISWSRLHLYDEHHLSSATGILPVEAWHQIFKARQLFFVPDRPPSPPWLISVPITIARGGSRELTAIFVSVWPPPLPGVADYQPPPPIATCRL
jgi:hypothetical protein